MHALSVSFHVLDIDDGYAPAMFELLIDGIPMSTWLGDGNGGVPLALAREGLPRWSLVSPSAEPDIHIVTVCLCGEPGCGHSRCRVRRDGEGVVFEDFRGDVGPAEQALRLEVSAEQFDAVVQQIMAAAA